MTSERAKSVTVEHIRNITQPVGNKAGALFEKSHWLSATFHLPGL